MSLTKSDRILLIREISDRLSPPNFSYTYIDLVLEQFNCPTTETWQSSPEEYVIAMVKNLNDDSLLEIARHVGYHLEDSVPVQIPTFWKPDCFRLFISHLAEHRAEAADLKEWLEQMDVAAFVAHDDIETTKLWENEILSALATCQAMVALIRPGFHDSQWTDQELGYGIGRDILIISVRLGQNPRGFIGKFQAESWDERYLKDLADKIIAILGKHVKTSRSIAEMLVLKIEKTANWEIWKTQAKRLDTLTYWDDSLSERCRIALANNSHVRTSHYLPGRINARIRAFEASK